MVVVEMLFLPHDNLLAPPQETFKIPCCELMVAFITRVCCSQRHINVSVTQVSEN